MLRNCWDTLKQEYNMRQYHSVLFSFFIAVYVNAQDKAELNVAIDSTDVKIGAQLNYTLQVKADSMAQVIFPEQAIFSPFELLEESPIDTLRTQSHYLYTKKYALIHFDSGNYFIPQQQLSLIHI